MSPGVARGGQVPSGGQNSFASPSPSRPNSGAMRGSAIAPQGASQSRPGQPGSAAPAPAQQLLRPGQPQAPMGARLMGGASPPQGYVQGGQLRAQSPQSMGYRGVAMGPSPR